MISAVEAAGREALAEMRRLLGLLRSSETAPLEPAPGLGSLPELMARLGRAGLQTQVSGEAGTLPISLDLTTYRIVQESLTNALRHAEPRFAELQFHRTSDSLQVTVTSPLSEAFGSRLAGTGHGLDGIRERALAVGGRASSGVRGGDFVVDVCLPLEGWAS
jgi:signal transduction histidine kinase